MEIDHNFLGYATPKLFQLKYEQGDDPRGVSPSSHLRFALFVHESIRDLTAIILTTPNRTDFGNTQIDHATF